MKNHRYYPWVVVALLWTVALLNYMDRQMLSTMQAAMKADIAELNKAEAFGALMAVFLWVYGFVSPLAGMIADKVSRKWLIVGSLFVWSVVTFLMGYADSFRELYGLRALMGLSEALYIPSALSLIADWHSGKSRSLAIGIHTTGFYVGQAIGGFGAMAAMIFSWQSTFHGFGLIGIVYSFVLILFLYENPNHRKSEIRSASEGGVVGKNSVWAGLTVVFSTFAFWIILFYFAAPSLPGWAMKNWLPTLFSSSLGIPMSQAGPLSTITIAASSFLGVIAGGALSDRWVQQNLRGRIYISAIGLGMTIPALLLLGFGHGFLPIIGASLLFGVGFGFFDANNMPILCQFVSAKYRATAYGIMNMVGVFFGAIVTQVFGKWTDKGSLGEGFALLSMVVAIVVAFQLYFLHPKVDNLK